MAKAKKLESIKDLRPDPKNANRHTERGTGLLENSLRNLGAGRSVVASKEGVMIAGNATLEAAASAGMEVEIVPSDGKKLIVVQRTDLSANDEKARLLALADNRIAELNLDWEPDALADASDLDLDSIGFSEKEIAELVEVEDEPDVKTITCPRCGAQFTSEGDILVPGENNAEN